MIKSNSQTTTIKFNTSNLDEGQVKSLAVLLGGFNLYARTGLDKGSDEKMLNLDLHEEYCKKFKDLLDSLETDIHKATK